MPAQLLSAILFVLSLGSAALAEGAEGDGASSLQTSASPTVIPAAATAPPDSAPHAIDDGRSSIPPSAQLAAADDDDPKLQRAAGVRDRGPIRADDAHESPAVKLAYRHLDLPNLKGTGMTDTADLSFHVIELDIYPISRRYLRLGLDAEFGYGIGILDDQPARAWYLTTGANLGFQYPWRVTPFIDGRLVAGLLGGDVIGQTAIAWIYMAGFDSGIELYIAGRFYVSVAIGYLHTGYNGVDLPYTKAHPTEDARREVISGDTFTFKIGLGL